MRLGFTPKNRLFPDQGLVPVYNERRFHHTWYLGKTGQGKSTALVNAASADIVRGDGIAFFDPHGEAIETILQHVPPEKADKVVLFDPSDRSFPVGFNPLHGVPRTRLPSWPRRWWIPSNRCGARRTSRPRSSTSTCTTRLRLY